MKAVKQLRSEARMADKESDSWKTSEVARLLRMSSTAVLELREKGILKGFQPGEKEWQFLKSDVLAYMREKGIPLPEEGRAA
jgi:hypothetical protein